MISTIPLFLQGVPSPLFSTIAIALILFIAALILSYRNLKLGFVMFLLLTPLMHKELFSFLVWDLLPARLAALGIIVASIGKMTGWIRENSWAKFQSKSLGFIKHDPFFVLLIAIWIVRGLSLFRSEVIGSSFPLFGFYSIILAMYVVFKYLLDVKKDSFYEKVLNIYLWLGLFAGLFALFQLQQRLCCRNTIGAVWVIPGYTPRLGSTFWDVNHFGGFLVTLIPLYFFFIFIKKSITQKTFFALGTGFLLWLLFMTQSRSSWLGLTFGMGLSFLLLYWNKLRKTILIAAIAGLLLMIAGFAYTTYSEISIRDKAARYMHYRLDSTDTHFMLLEGSAEIFFDNLVIGSGYGTFDRSFRKTETARDYFDREPSLREQKVPSHSVWGEVLGETGAAGIVVFASFILIIIGSVIASLFTTRSPRMKYLGIGILGSTVSLLTAGLFYSYNMEFFWVMLFLAIGYSYIALKDKFSLKFVEEWWYNKKITPYLIIAPLALFYIFVRMGSTTLIDVDEAIYAKVARNIAESGDWLSLRWDNMNEYWFEKPPLYMWLTAAVYKITNFNSFGARFVSGIFGFAGILMAYLFGKKLYNKTVGIFSALILLSTVDYLYYSRNAMLDVSVTFFITSTLYFFYSALKSKKRSWLYYALAGVTLGLGVMTKAVIGLLPIPIIILYLSYLWIVKDRSLKISFKGLIYFVLAAFIVAAPWHLYSLYVHGYEFWDDYFVDHMLGRGLSGFGHEKPFVWFLEVIKVSFRIWVLPFGLALLTLPFFDKKDRKQLVLLLISVFFVLLFFSVSKDKLKWYIMPIYPFMAILAARFMERFIAWFNDLIKNEFQFNAKVLRSLAVYIVFIIAAFHVITTRDRIYYPDFNRDKVELIKIHNQLYPIEDHPDRKLYFNSIGKAVALFYSDHRIDSVSRDGLLEKIDQAAPGQNNVFLIPEDMYYNVQGEQEEISAPLVLEVRGAAGDWVLVKSLSRVEVLQSELVAFIAERTVLEGLDLLGTITPLERQRLLEVNTRINEIVTKLTEYGYPPY